MTKAAVAALSILMLAGCSPKYTRYSMDAASAPQTGERVDPRGSLFATGVEAIRAGDDAGAEASLMQHLATEPDDPYALLSMGVVMERTERTAEAVTYYQRAALYGETAELGEVMSLDPAAARKPETVRDLALINIAQLARRTGGTPSLP